MSVPHPAHLLPGRKAADRRHLPPSSPAPTRGIRFSRSDWGIRTSTLFITGVYGVRAVTLYAYQLAAVQSLGTDRFGSLNIMYSAAFIVGFVLGQSMENTLSRHIAEAKSHHQSHAGFARRVVGWFTGILLVFALVSWLGRDLIVERLFPEAPYLFYFFVATAVLECYDLGIRGILRGQRAFGLYGTSVIVRVLARLLFQVVLVNVLAMGLLGAGVALVAGLLFSLAVLLLFVRHSQRQEPDQPPGEALYDPPAVTRYQMSMILMLGFSAIYYYIGPLLIKLQGVEQVNELAGMFSLATYVSRFPLQLADALAVGLLPFLAGLRIDRKAKDGWPYVVRSCQILLPIGVVCTAALYFLGPWAMQLFHKEYQYSHAGMGWLGLSVLFLMLLQVLSQFQMSRSRTGVLILAWFLGCAGLAAASFFGPGPVLTRLELGYAGSSLVMCLLVFVQAARHVQQNRAGGKQGLESP